MYFKLISTNIFMNFVNVICHFFGTLNKKQNQFTQHPDE